MTTTPIVKMVEFILEKFFDDQYETAADGRFVFLIFEVDNLTLYEDLLNMFAPFQISAKGQAKGDPPQAPFAIQFETSDVSQTQYHIMRYMLARVTRSMNEKHELIDYRIIGANYAPKPGVELELECEKTTFYRQTFLKDVAVHKYVQRAEARRLKELDDE